MADNSQSSSQLTDATNSTVYRLNESAFDKSIRMEDFVNYVSSAGSSMVNTDSLTVEDSLGSLLVTLRQIVMSRIHSKEYLII